MLRQDPRWVWRFLAEREPAMPDSAGQERDAAAEAGGSDGASQLDASVLRAYEKGMGELGAQGPVSLPEGAGLRVGAPAVAPAVDRLEALRQAIITVPEVAEAYLPLIFAKEIGSSPQLFVAIVPHEGTSPSELAPRVSSAL